MEHLHSSSQKRPMLDDSSETTTPSSDHQAKRMRLTLPPISATLPTPSSSFSSFQLPIPPPLLEPNNSSGSLPLLPSISATDSPVLPISSPRALSGHRELPPIDSLGPLPPIPPIPHFPTPSKSMSISAILSNNEDDPIIKKLNMNIKEMGIGNEFNNTLDYNSQYHFKSYLPHHASVDSGFNQGNAEDKNININGTNKNIEVNEIDEDGQDDEFSLDRSLFEGLVLQREPHLIVKNDDALNMEGREEHHLG